MMCMGCTIFCIAFIGLIVFAASVSGIRVECDTIDLNNYSRIKFNIYKKVALTDTPKFLSKDGNSIRLESSSLAEQFLHIGEEDKLEVVALPTRGINAEVIKDFEAKSTFIVEEGLCLEPGTVSFASKSKKGFYLSIKDDANIFLEKIEDGCSKWRTCFIAQDEESLEFKDKTNPILLESAITPNNYLTYDGTTLSRTGKPKETTEGEDSEA